MKLLKLTSLYETQSFISKEKDINWETEHLQSHE